MAVQVGHPELVARPDAIHRDLDRPAGVAAVVERLDQVHVRAADVVRGPGLPPDLERVADRDHPVGARAEQREVTPVGVQGVTLLGPRIDLPGDRDRLLAEGGRFGVAINQHQDLAEARERTRPFGRRPVGRGDCHGLAVGLEGAGHVAEHPQAAPELLAQDACSERVGDPVDATVGFLAVRNGAPVIGRQVRCLARLAQQLDPVEAGDCRWIVDVVPEIERTFVLDQCGTERVRPHCRLGGADGRCERSVVLPGGGPVVRQLGPAARFRSAADGRSLLERLGEGPMQGASLAGQQVVVHDLLDERVAECIALHAVAGLDDEEVAADRGAESFEQFVLGQAGDLGEQLVLDAPAGDCGHAQHGRCCLRHCGNVSEEDLAERRREARAGAALAARSQQLLGEERVAVRAAVDIRHELGVGLRAEDCVEQRGDLRCGRDGRDRPARRGPRDPVRRATAAAGGDGGARHCGTCR